MAPFSSAPRLVVISDSGHARQIPIPFKGIVLGRDAQLGPPFSTDEYVSRNHVSVQPRGDGSVEVADLGSANGTYVNGARVQAQARMQDSDVLRIGQIELKLAAPAGLGDQTVTAGASAAQDVPHLTIVKPGAFGGRRFQLPGDYLVVGRDWASDICLDDPHVSPTHAALRRRGDAVYVQDLGSASGTFVNSEAVTAVRELQPGDIVAFAGIQARFGLADGPKAVPAPGAVPPAGALPTERAGAAVNYRIDGQPTGIINNVTRDQNYYIQQREGFLREIAATKTKARWLVWTGFASFVAGFAIFAAGVLGFLKQINGTVATGTPPNGMSSFGSTVDGVPPGLVAWAMAALGVLLIIVGIVLHIVAASRRKRVDRDFPAWPWPGAAPAGRRA